MCVSFVINLVPSALLCIISFNPLSNKEEQDMSIVHIKELREDW